MNRLLISLFLLSTGLPLAAQKVTAVKTTVDVGRTGYEQPVTAVFDMVNKGGKKIRIKAVNPDCQCTVVDYPKGELPSRFQIRMTYDARQLGYFNKQAAVVCSDQQQPFYLTMTGRVLPELQDLSAKYPVDMGPLLLDRTDLEYDDINKGDIRVQRLHLYNNGQKACTPYLMHMPDYLTAVMTPERLSPGMEGTMTVTLNSKRLRDYGLTQCAVYLAANPGDIVSTDREVTVSAVMLPAFTGMTGSQRQYAPRMELSTDHLDIDLNGKAKKQKKVIKITNRGRTELQISSLQLFTTGLIVALDKRNLQPGETAKLKVTLLRDDLKKVRTRPRILMITNDPDHPKVTITINK